MQPLQSLYKFRKNNTNTNTAYIQTNFSQVLYNRTSKMCQRASKLQSSMQRYWRLKQENLTTESTAHNVSIKFIHFEDAKVNEGKSLGKWVFILQQYTLITPYQSMDMCLMENKSTLRFPLHTNIQDIFKTKMPIFKTENNKSFKRTFALLFMGHVLYDFIHTLTE